MRKTEIKTEHNTRDFQITTKLSIIIPSSCWKFIRYMVDRSPVEISGVGVIKINEVENINGIKTIKSLKVEKIIFPKQINSSTLTELDQNDLMLEIAKLGADAEHIRFWWHSHVNFDVFWSGQDTATIDGFMSQWVVSLVTNKKNENKVRFDIYNPIRTNIVINSIIIEHDDKNNDLEKLYLEKCHVQKPEVGKYVSQTDDEQGEIYEWRETDENEIQ